MDEKSHNSIYSKIQAATESLTVKKQQSSNAIKVTEIHKYKPNRSCIFNKLPSDKVEDKNTTRRISFEPEIIFRSNIRQDCFKKCSKIFFKIYQKK